LINRQRLYFIVFFTSLILSYYQTVRVDAPNYDLKLARHNSIVENTAKYPYQYRLLNPYMADASFSLFKVFLPEKASFLLAYAIQNIIVYFFLLLMAANFFILYFDEIGTAIGVLLFAVLVPLSLTGYDTLGDMTTAGLMALGFFLINTGRILYLYPLVFIGTFNELQILLLVMFYFCGKKDNFKSGKVWINSVMLSVTFALTYAIIYLLRGGEASGGDFVCFLTKDAAFNISHPNFILLWAIMIIPLLYFAVKNLKQKPGFLRRNLLVTLPAFYVLAFFFIGRMREIDKALTIFLILIPLALITLVPNHFRKEPPQAPTGSA
jgi:hypothetical protein